MPPDTSKPRRTQRKLTEAELKEIEQKRIKGEISCAECRRLKLRCDKKVPCSSCVRRGCESICPCGILSAGQGTRFILADTDKLHQKISDMSQRIRALEDGLAILQSSVSGERHPLLAEDLLKVKFGPEANDPTIIESPSRDVDAAMSESIDALGTLTLNSEGEMKYFGRSAGSQTLMEVGEDFGSDSEDDENSWHAPSNPFSDIFPPKLGSNSPEVVLESLESSLPSRERATALCISWVDHASLFFRPIKRDELMDTLLPTIYDTAARAARPVGKTYTHDLSVLYSIFALGALFDLGLPPCSAEAESYFDLARAAFSLKPILDCPHINAVSALGLMATYCSMVEKKYTRDTAWMGMSLTSKLAQSLGLHRDSARWNMDPKAVEKSRNLWWEVFSSDMSNSLALGRPPAIHLSFVDCEYPIDEEATLSNAGEVEPGVWRMKFVISRDVFVPVLEATLAAEATPYSRVLEIDRKIRQMSFPESFKPYVQLSDGEAQFYSSSLSLRDFYASQFRTISMQYLHRSFFAQAVLDHPANPLLSPFAPSFLTAYRCASIIIKASAHQFDRCARQAMRVWFFMNHVFSAAVVVGTVVSRNSSSNLAPSALVDLTLAVKLFEQSAPHSHKARTALLVLNKLKDHAIRAYSEYNSTAIPGSIPTTLTNDQDNNVATDCLAIFGGQARVLTKRHRPKASSTTTSHDTPSPAKTQSGSSSPPISNVILGDGSVILTDSELPSSVSTEQVHPSLMDFLGEGTPDFTQTFLKPPIPLLQPEHQIYQQQNQPSELEPSPFPNTRPVNNNGLAELYSNFMQYLATKNAASPEWSGVWAGTNMNVGSTDFPQFSSGVDATMSGVNPFEESIFVNNTSTSSNQVSDSMSMTNSAVEMGLVTQSEIDAGWATFMQDIILPTASTDGATL